MERHQVSITYNDPETKKQLTKVHKLAPGETELQGLLFILKAMEFFYGQDIKFHINEKP